MKNVFFHPYWSRKSFLILENSLQLVTGINYTTNQKVQVWEGAQHIRDCSNVLLGHFTYSFLYHLAQSLVQVVSIILVKQCRVVIALQFYLPCK